ncbi:MAG TPA: acyltransferase [Acidimicrobiales bacterium]|nr:acyltransferase [Acidimicrobiales bacterium]
MIDAGELRTRHGAPQAASPVPERARLVVPAIDGFRGLAAMTVVLYHCFIGAGTPRLDEGPVRAVLQAGYLGVDFFFVISGFVLFLPAALNDGDIGDRRSYFLRRLARIGPAYYVFLLLAILLTPVLTETATELPLDSWKGALLFFSHLGFLQQHVGRWFGEPYPLLALSWTLTLEVLFYLLLPYVARSFHRHPFRWLAGALAVSTGWKLFAVNVPSTLSWLGADSWDARQTAVAKVVLLTQLPGYVVHFAAGMAAALLFVYLRRHRPRLHPRLVVGVQLLAVAGVLLLMRDAGIRALSGSSPFDQWTRTTPVALVFAAVVVATALAPSRAQWPVANPVARWLGDVSYGTYLCHLLLVIAAITVFDFAPDGTWAAFLRLTAVVVPAALLTAWASFAVIERPARRWASRRTKARMAALGAGPAGTLLAAGVVPTPDEVPPAGDVGIDGSEVPAAAGTLVDEPEPV